MDDGSRRLYTGSGELALKPRGQDFYMGDGGVCLVTEIRRCHLGLVGVGARNI